MKKAMVRRIPPCINTPTAGIFKEGNGEMKTPNEYLRYFGSLAFFNVMRQRRGILRAFLSTDLLCSTGQGVIDISFNISRFLYRLR